MKKLIIGMSVLVAAGAAVHRFGPALGKRAMNTCHDMFDHMPEDFPPKRMTHGIEELREQNARILLHLEREPTAQAAA